MPDTPPKAAPDDEANKRQHAELLAVYHVVIEDIRQWKRDQWAAFTWFLAVVGAILYATGQIAPKVPGPWKVAVAVAAGLLIVFAGVVAGVHIARLQSSLRSSRELKSNLYDRMSDAIKELVPQRERFRHDALEHSVGLQLIVSVVFAGIAAVGVVVALAK